MKKYSILFSILVISCTSSAQKKQGQEIIDSLTVEASKKVSDTSKGKALEYFQKAYTINEETHNKNRMAVNLIQMGETTYKLSDYHKALQYTNKALLISREIGALSLESSALKNLSLFYEKIGQTKRSFEYFKEYIIIRDSVINLHKIKEIDQTETKFAVARQKLTDSLSRQEEKLKMEIRHQAEVHQKNQARNIFIGTTLGILALAGGLWSRLRYIHRSKIDIEKEKDRSEKLLLNILPAEIAAELKEKGKAEAKDFDTVSILFTDFKEFTQVSEKLSAQELVGEINYYFEAFDDIISKYKIEKIKTIGDAYMAAGGLPVPTSDSVKNTVLAALEMQAFMIERRQQIDAGQKPAFEMRVGIHTGPVVAGIVGVKKFQYDLWGDTVNTAHRMESNGEIDKVNISRSTYDMLKDDPKFTFIHRGKFEVKGKGEMEMYFVEQMV